METFYKCTYSDNTIERFGDGFEIKLYVYFEKYPNLGFNELK
jgi:hypothetical protein